MLGQEMVREKQGKWLEDQLVSSEGERQVPAAFAPGDKPEQDFPAELRVGLTMRDESKPYCETSVTIHRCHLICKAKERPC